MKTVLLILATLSTFSAHAAVPNDASAARPLAIGDTVPDVSVRSFSGESLSLSEITSEKPTMLIFYRGGWCPYCNRHLADVQKLKDTIDGMGFQVIALSPDRPEKIKEAMEAESLGYQLYSDSAADAMKAFGVAFKLDTDLVSTYKNEYGIYIESDSVMTHHILPVPALYLIGTDGKINFAHFDPNYRERLKAATILAELNRVRALELR